MNKEQLSELKQEAITTFNAWKDKFSSDKDTPRDPSDDIHGALFNREAGVWRGANTLKGQNINIYLFIAGEFYSKGQKWLGNMIIRQGVDNGFVVTGVAGNEEE